MASQDKVLFVKDSVYIHINDARDKDAHIPGRVFLIQKADGLYLEWKAEEGSNLESQPDHEWDVIGAAVSFRNDKNNDTVTMNAKMDSRRKYNISFDVLDLKSFKRNAPNRGWAYIIFILKDGTTFPALHFHNGGSKALLKELENFVQIRRSPNDQMLFIVQEHDPEMLSKSLNELQLFSESSGRLISNFIRDPYSATMGRFSKVTNFLRDALLSDNPHTRPKEEVAELLHDDIAGMEISRPEETDFELIDVVTKTKLPPKPAVKRGDPLNAQQWASHFDTDGSIKQVDDLKEIIFRGGVDPAMRCEVWKYLLGYYSWGSTLKKRQEDRKRKVDDYFRMKLQWKTISAEQEKRFSLFRDRKSLIEKDVSRTDRNEKFFSGDRNQNLQVLYDILMTYCMYNFDLGYVQGMSDLLSPVLVVMENEVDAFWCFAGLMERMGQNFEKDQAGMKKQLSQIQKLMQVYDPDLYAYLDGHDSGNFYFCFRWILIHFKREFHFHEISRLWEVLWTDLPCQNFHLIYSLAILDSEKSTLIENEFGFTEILKHINDITLCIPLEDMLKKAEQIFLQLRRYDKLPAPVKEILGLTPLPSSSKSSRTGTPASQKASAVGRQANGHIGVSNGSSPDDSSIEVLGDSRHFTAD